MTRKQKSFLLEIGTEELPPNQIEDLISSLATLFEEKLKELGLLYDSIKTFSSPRRLAILVSHLTDKQPDQTVGLRGPSVEIAFDKSGQPTIAAKKFAENCGVEISQLGRTTEKKGEILFYQTVKPGKKTSELLPEVIIHAVKKLPLKRAMHWGEHVGPFIRPVHWVVAIFDQEVIPVEIFGTKATNKTFGHRFHYPKNIIINDPDNYENLLAEKGWVLVDADKRKQKIRQQISSLTQDDQALVSESLLATTTNVVEWPKALVGRFNARFLKIPHEVLITTLENHQRCFPIAYEEGELLPRFVIIANIESKLPQQVITGNEKVVQARFTDAEYFYQNDCKTIFAENLNKLKTISFQEKLGSLYDKTLRLKSLASFIASQLNIDVASASRAAELSKCDLVTSMVWEFPELQGIMGYYYAQPLEDKTVATAIKEQYLPRFSKDLIPETKTGCALALADRIDNLVGFFGINKVPSGDKDPFALRRAASGILRIILEKDLPLDLKEMLEKSCLTYSDVFKNREEVVAKVLDFIYERLRFFYIEQNKNINFFRAIMACMPTNLQDFTRRYEAINKFSQLPESGDLVEIYKRIRNILEKAQLPEKTKFTLSLATETVEHNLAVIVEQKSKIILNHYQNKKYQELLLELIKLKLPLEDFFNKVMVMTDDEKLRNNRLALLRSIQTLFALTADLSALISG